MGVLEIINMKLNSYFSHIDKIKHFKDVYNLEKL